MWDIIWVSPQEHRSVSVRRQVFQKTQQCPMTVMQWSMIDYIKMTLPSGFMDFILLNILIYYFRYLLLGHVCVGLNWLFAIF